MSEETKSLLRKKVLTLLRNQKEEDRLKKSSIVLEKLLALPEFQNSRTIMLYVSFDGEIETSELMKQAKALGKKIVLPIIIREKRRIIPRLIENLDGGLETGPYSIKQPKYEDSAPLELDDLDLVIVPGVAFDKQKNRLGRGQGYYDRFLGGLPSNIPTIGLAFDFQIVDCLPDKESHDIPVSRVISN